MLWRRLQPLLSLYQNILGMGGIFKVLVSGLMLSLIEFGGLALIFPFLVTDQNFHRHIAQQVEGMPLSYVLEDHQVSVLIVGLSITLIYVFRGCISLYLIAYQARAAARVSIVSGNNFIAEALTSKYQLFLKHSPGKVTSISVQFYRCNASISVIIRWR